MGINTLPFYKKTATELFVSVPLYTHWLSILTHYISLKLLSSQGSVMSVLCLVSFVMQIPPNLVTSYSAVIWDYTQSPERKRRAEQLVSVSEF